MIRLTVCVLTIGGILLVAGCDDSAPPPPPGYTEKNPDDVTPIAAPGSEVGAQPLDRGGAGGN